MKWHIFLIVCHDYSGMINVLNTSNEDNTTTNKYLVARNDLQHAADWQPETAHSEVRAEVEDSIAKRLTEIRPTVADFGYKSATVNLHDLQDNYVKMSLVTTNSCSARIHNCVTNSF